MIYTFGRTKGYDEHLCTQVAPKKMGKQDDYAGGSVWRTRKEAQAFVDSLPNKYCPNWKAEDFSVYGVNANWETDVYKGEPEALWHSLWKDAPLVKLENDNA